MEIDGLWVGEAVGETTGKLDGESVGKNVGASDNLLLGPRTVWL